MVIRILALVSAADTGIQGVVIRDLVHASLLKGVPVKVSFSGIDTATSSFVNVCFVDLLSYFSLGFLKKNVLVVDSTVQINDMIKSRLLQVAANEAA